MKSHLITLILLIVSQAAWSQTLHYEVIKGSKKLGDMTVHRNQHEHSVNYEINSKVTFRLLFSFTVDYKSTSEYKHDRLINEHTNSQLNGKTQKKSTIWFDGEKYTLDLNGSRSSIDEPINYSIAAIYYEEPEDEEKVFSPQFGYYLTFKKTEAHTYELESPDGTNEYTYTNGICSEVKVFRDFAKFSFVMAPESLAAVKSKRIVGGGISVD